MQMTDWIKFYTEVVENKQLGTLAFEDRWHYIVIYSLYRRGVIERGSGSLSPQILKDKIATQLGLQFSEVDKLKYRLIEAGLIDSEWNPY